MAYRPQFDLDLRYGEATEKALANLLLRATIEVKDDRKSRTTGNFCVEFKQLSPDRQSYVKSGILVTTAMYWAFKYDEDSYLIIPTETVRSVARRFAQDPRNVRMTGDNGNHSVLVPISALIPFMSRVK